MSTNTENQEDDDSLMTISHSDTNAIFLALDALGVSRSQFARLKTDGDLCQQVATMLHSPGFAESISVTQAKKILGRKNVLGPAEIEKHFPFKVPDVPPIPFSREDLTKAKYLNQFLVLRVDQPITMQGLCGYCQAKYDNLKAGKVLYNDSWYKNEKFYTEESPRAGWYLVSKEPITNSFGKNYLSQTQAIADYLSDLFDENLPDNYSQAVAEFLSKKDALSDLMKKDWQQAAKELSELKLNQLFRRTPVEQVYDTLLYFFANNMRLLEEKYDWSFRLGAHGGLVDFGGCGSDGAGVDDDAPGGYRDALGVCFSRGL